MKFKIEIFLAAAATILTAASPMVSTSMSTDNGGSKAAIDAYSDGAGVLMINQASDTKFDNSAMNKLVFKYGDAAKASNTTLKNQVTVLSTTSTAQEKADATAKLEVAKVIVNPPANGTICDDGLSTTSGDVWMSNVCAGINNEGTSCDDGIGVTYADKMVSGNCVGTYATSCKIIKATVPASTDGAYSIDPDGPTGAAPINAYCDMTTDGGGWTMYYSTSNYYHLADSPTNAIAYGSDGYSRDLRNMSFKDILYVRHSDNQKDWFKIDSGTTITVQQFISGGVLNASSASIGTLTGGGGASTAYKYQLNIGDKMWMQIGLMISGYNGCYKQTGSWCSDTTTNYYRINGEGNGVADNAGFYGVAFRENGHRILANKLMSVGIR